MNLREQTLEVAKGKMGVHEQGGSNRGPEVEMFQKEAGISRGDPWCAAFVNWCAKTAAGMLKVISPLESVPLQGYVPSYVESFPEVKPEEVLPGDLFCVWSKTNGRYSHIGLVRSVNLNDKVFVTVEGNSNNEGSREGYEVCSNVRKITSNIRFLRWTRVVKPVK